MSEQPPGCGLNDLLSACSCQYPSNAPEGTKMKGERVTPIRELTTNTVVNVSIGDKFAAGLISDMAIATMP